MRTVGLTFDAPSEETQAEPVEEQVDEPTAPSEETQAEPVEEPKTKAEWIAAANALGIKVPARATIADIQALINGAEA